MGFLDREKKRYERLKNQLFSAAARPEGMYKSKRRPFCLADGHSAENLHEWLRESAIRYFAERGIPWHDGCPDGEQRPRRLPSGHLCCSQTACVNALAPLMYDADLLSRTFRVFLPEMAEPLPMTADASAPGGPCPLLSFEWIGTRNYLGEVGSRTRGANATSADFAFRFRRHDGRVQLVLGEWKYTECYAVPLPPPDQINPTRLRVYREAFGRWREEQSDLPGYEVFFADPFYQLMRLTLLAREMEQARRDGRGEMDADIVGVAHVSPNANVEFAEGFTSPTFARYGHTVTAAWTQVAPKDRFVSIPSESLLTAIAQSAPTAAQGWAQWLLDRYGWWRAGPADEACAVTSLRRIQKHFHGVIMGRAADLIREHKTPLPELTDLLSAPERKGWFAVPGMYGGFSYWLEGEGEAMKLVCESWCRVVEGSGQRHEITESGAKLLEEGFV